MSDLPGTEEVPTPREMLTALVEALTVEDSGDGGYRAHGPDWYGDRVFGGVVVGIALMAALRTAPDGMRAHSLHATFLGPLRPGPIDIAVAALRDGRTFSTREVSLRQDGRETTRARVSFHGEEAGIEYQLGPPDVPLPDSLTPFDEPGPFEARSIGVTEREPDGPMRSTRRIWMRAVEAVGDDPGVHLGLVCYFSDWTGTGFRPTTEPEWGTHTDASIDHAVWFHGPFRIDDWVLADFHTVVNRGNRGTIRGEFFANGCLVMSMAQELLIRPLRSADLA